MWSALHDLAAEAGESSADARIRLAATWLPIIIPVTLAAAGVVVRAFTARERLRKKYSDDVWKIRDKTQAAIVLPVIASIVVKAHAMVTWPREGLPALLAKGQPGDPETEVARRLARRTFNQALGELAQYLGRAGDAERMPERLLTCERRQGWAMSIFLPAWLYLSFWASQTGLQMPVWLTVIAALLAAAMLGWFTAEKFASVREANAFSALVDDVSRLRVAEDLE